jgi:hypothetical protein
LGAKEGNYNISRALGISERFVRALFHHHACRELRREADIRSFISSSKRIYGKRKMAPNKELSVSLYRERMQNQHKGMECRRRRIQDSVSKRVNQIPITRSFSQLQMPTRKSGNFKASTTNNLIEHALFYVIIFSLLEIYLTTVLLEIFKLYIGLHYIVDGVLCNVM